MSESPLYDIHAILRISPFVPVVTLTDAEQALPLARALFEGGIKIIEVTLRTGAGLESIRRIREGLPDMTVGAGTITAPHMFWQAREAGAQFAVSPGCTDAMAKTAQMTELAFLPGVSTPSDILRAREGGYTALKFFPAETAGGVPALRQLMPVFHDVVFCPTGGITLDNAPEYLALPAVMCVGGSWLAPKDLVARGDWAAIRTIARESLARLDKKQGKTAA